MFIKECKKIFRSLVFWIYAGVMLLGYVTQFAPELKQQITKPEKGQESYGTMALEKPDILMPAAVQSLVNEYLQGYYAAWPMSFYKEVHLKEADSLKMAAIIEELTGLTKEELDSFENYKPDGYVTKLNYERFKELMKEADQLLGGSSYYREENLISQFSQIPLSYEEALAEYQANVTKDALGEVYGRLYCDYMGIFLAIIPVFAAADIWALDRRAKARALVYSRKASSVKIIGIRYIALLGCSMLPLLLTFLHAVFKLNLLYRDIGIVWGKAIFLVLFWLLPELMFVIALAVLLTELMSPLLAVLIQGLWWFVALQLQTNQLSGHIHRWELIIRHNQLGGSTIFQSEWRVFLQNRSCYFIMAVVCVGAEILLFERKRRGIK